MLKRVCHDKVSASAGTQEYRLWGQILYCLRLNFKGKTWQEAASTLMFDPDVMAHRNFSCLYHEQTPVALGLPA